MPTVADPFAEIATALARVDLRALGAVIVRPGKRGTDTLWCEPSVDPTPLWSMAEQAGAAIGALILVFGQEAQAFVHPSWRSETWFTRYVEDLTQGICRLGLEDFLGTVALGGGPNRTAMRN